MIATLAKRLPKTPTEWAIVIGIVVLIIGVVVFASWMDRRRRRGMVADLAGRGFAGGEPSDGAFAEPPPPVTGNPLFVGDASKFLWAMAGVDRGRPVTVGEHEYVHGSGKHRNTIRHLIASTPLPTGLAPVTVERKRVFRTHRPARKPAKLPLDSEAFNKACDLFGDDTAALALLSPEVQAVAAGLTKAQWVHFDGETLQVGERGVPNAGSIDRVLGLLDAVVGALPVEVREAAGV